MQNKKIHISLDGNTHLRVLNAWLDALEEQDRESYVSLIGSRHQSIGKNNSVTESVYTIEFIGIKSTDVKKQIVHIMHNGLTKCDTLDIDTREIYFENLFFGDTLTQLPIVYNNLEELVYFFLQCWEKKIFGWVKGDKYYHLKMFFVDNSHSNEHTTYESLKSTKTKFSKNKCPLSKERKAKIDAVISDVSAIIRKSNLPNLPD